MSVLLHVPLDSPTYLLAKVSYLILIAVKLQYQLNSSGVSRISARGVLKVRPDTRRGGCCRFLARYEKREGGRGSVFGPIRKAGWGVGVLSVSGLIRKVWGGGGGGGGGGYDRVSGGPGYSTVVEFMRTGINRQRKRAAIIIKCGPKSYEFIYERTYGRGGCSSTRSTPPLPGYATEMQVTKRVN